MLKTLWNAQELTILCLHLHCGGHIWRVGKKSFQQDIASSIFPPYFFFAEKIQRFIIQNTAKILKLLNIHLPDCHAWLGEVGVRLSLLSEDHVFLRASDQHIHQSYLVQQVVPLKVLIHIYVCMYYIYIYINIYIVIHTNIYVYLYLSIYPSI